MPAAVKRQVYAAYGRSRRKGVCCELDHLISLELGGSNRLRNLWPEPYDIVWNAHVKDRLDNRLHQMVCAGELDLTTAQQAIASDWIAAYKATSRLIRKEPTQNTKGSSSGRDDSE